MARKKPKMQKLAENSLGLLIGKRRARLLVGIFIALGGLGAINLDSIKSRFFESDYQHYGLDARFSPWFAHCSKVLDKFYYLNCYDYDLRGTRAVAYLLTAAQLAHHEAKRPQFSTDVELPKHARTEWEDYLHSGFDRGHVLSNQSMNANKRAQEATFLMSNITPQWPKVNQGIWLEIEKRERFLGKKFGAAQVLNVVEYPAAPKRLRAGNRPAIPSGYAKAICQAKFVRGDDGRMQIAANAAAAGDLAGCECYYVPNVKDPRQISAKDAKVSCAKLAELGK